MFKLPVPTNYEGVSSSESRNSEEKKLLNEIDDGNSVLQFLMEKNIIFEEKCLILDGDFRQCLLITKSRITMIIITWSIKFSNCWINSNIYL